MDQRSETLSIADVEWVKSLLQANFQHKRIAALFDVNQGRIAEINSGKKHPNVRNANGEIIKKYPIRAREAKR